MVVTNRRNLLGKLSPQNKYAMRQIGLTDHLPIKHHKTMHNSLP